ncbi:DUF1573 domain-containing protein [Flavobacterium amnicola]|jgi:hypothetical protein|nr:DUF1573 domain-containing protein [Flavobacterium amnicola]
MKNVIKMSMVAVATVLMSFSINSAISWKSDTVDVGEIPQGTPKMIEFTFKNTGDKEVIISSVKTSCGCTASDYTKEAIAPGKSGFVKATYNAAVKGNFTKTVTVTTNADETAKILTLKGNVI